MTQLVFVIGDLTACRRRYHLPLVSSQCSHADTITQSSSQTVYWIVAASKGWIKQTYRKMMHTQITQYTQNHITGNDLVEME